MYGGTKTEMERLLADAEKFSGVKYDISNLNDVYQAIHVIQDELEITGTTAKEAATTLQGSMSMTKAAFTNFLAGSGDVDAFVDSFVNLVDIVIDRVQELVPRLATGLVEIAQKTFEQLKTRLPESIQGMFDNIPDIGKMISDKLASSEMSEQIQNIINSFKNLFEIVSNGEFLNTIITAFTNFALTLIDFTMVVIPPVLDFFSWLAINLPNLMPIIAGIGAAFATIQIGAIVADIAKFISTMGGLSEIFTTLGTAISTIFSPLTLIAIAIGALIAMFVHLYQTNEEFRTNITEIWTNIQTSISSIIESIKTIFNDFMTAISESGTMQEMIDTFKSLWEGLEVFFANLFEAIATIIETAFSGISSFLEEHGETITTILVGAWELIWNTIKPIIDLITATLKGDFEGVKQALFDIMESIRSNIITIWTGILNIFLNTAQTIVTSVTEIFNRLSSNIGAAMSNVFAKITEFSGNFSRWVSSDLPKIINNIVKWFLDLPAKIGAELSKALDQIKQFGKNTIQAISSINLFEAGKNLIQGLVNGIKEMANSAVAAVGNVVDGIKNAVTGKKGFDTHSPSIWGKDVGENVIIGIAKGFEKGSKDAVKKATELTNDLKYNLEAGIINEEKYYQSLATIRDSFFVENDKKWQEYGITIAKYENKQKQESLKTQQETYKQINELNDAIVTALKNRYDMEAKLQTDALKEIPKRFQTAYGSAADSINDAYSKASSKLETLSNQAGVTSEDIAIAYTIGQDQIRQAVETSYGDMSYIIQDFFAESGITADEYTQGLIDNITEELTAYEESFREKISMQQELIAMANLEYDAESARIKAEIKAIDDLTKAENKAAQQERKSGQLSELKSEYQAEEDPTKKARIQKQISELEADILRTAELDRREQQKEAFKNELAAASENRKTKVEAAKAEIEQITADRTAFYAKELLDVQLQYKQLTDAASLQAEAIKRLQNDTQKQIINLLQSYNPEYYKKGFEQGDNLVAGMMKALQDGEGMIKDKIEEILSAGGNISLRVTYPVEDDVPEAAGGAVLHKPTLLIAGEAGTEYILNQNQIGGVIQGIVSGVMSDLSRFAGATSSSESTLSSGEQIIYQTVNFNQPIESPYQVKRALMEANRETGDELRG